MHFAPSAAPDDADVVSLSDFPPGSVIDHDIMRFTNECLKWMRIDALTATEIGWATL